VKNRLFTIIMATFWLSSSAQDFSREGSARQMNALTDRDKVKFINQHFYKLYSADFTHATELAQWATEVSAKNKWREDEANANLSWGVVTYLAGKYDDVLPKYFRARDLYDSLGNKVGLANINNEMAVFYHKQKDLDKALACLDVSEKLAREINDLTALGTSLGHRGSFLAIRGRFTEAKPYYEEVYKIRVQTKDSIGLGYALNDLAEIASNENNLQQALTYIDQSTAIREKLGDAQGVAINYINKGESYFKFKDYKNATRWMEKCLEQSLAIGFTDLSRHTYDYLAKTYKAMGDYQKAFAWQERAIIFKDSLFNADRTRVIQEMQTKYETEKKEQQITLLNSENELKQATIERNYFLIGGLITLVLLISLGFYLWRYRDEQKHKAVLHEQKMRLREAQVNAVIESQEKERKRFASDLHDGMGQLISALQLNINAIQQQNEPEKRDVLFENSEQILTDIHGEIRNIAFNLMPPVLIKEGLLAGLQELIRRINKAGSVKVILSHHNMPARFNEVGEISLYRIIQELLSNIVKHAQATRVTVDFTGFEDEIVLTLEDDGIGYDLEKFQNHEGNGWRNISSRLNLIKGIIDFDVVAGRKNNTVIITVPMHSIKTTQAQPIELA
jgi:two-component system, NarL family, sensor kinase